jgi:hypothetical protein
MKARDFFSFPLGLLRPESVIHGITVKLTSVLAGLSILSSWKKKCCELGNWMD